MFESFIQVKLSAGEPSDTPQVNIRYHNNAIVIILHNRLSRSSIAKIKPYQGDGSGENIGKSRNIEVIDGNSQ